MPRFTMPDVCANVKETDGGVSPRSNGIWRENHASALLTSMRRGFYPSHRESRTDSHWGITVGFDTAGGELGAVLPPQ